MPVLRDLFNSRNPRKLHHYCTVTAAKPATDSNLLAASSFTTLKNHQRPGYCASGGGPGGYADHRVASGRTALAFKFFGS